MPRSRIAEELAAEAQARVQARTMEQRVESALRLGAESARLSMQPDGVSRAEADRHLAAIARRPCTWER